MPVHTPTLVFAHEYIDLAAGCQQKAATPMYSLSVAMRGHEFNQLHMRGHAWSYTRENEPWNLKRWTRLEDDVPLQPSGFMWFSGSMLHFQCVCGQNKPARPAFPLSDRVSVSFVTFPPKPWSLGLKSRWLGPVGSRRRIKSGPM